MESMSNAPYLMPKLRAGARMGHTEAKDAMILDGLWCAMTNQSMGATGELVAQKYGVSRAEQDDWSFHSHRKALEAMASGAFDAELVPVTVPGRKGDVVVNADEGPRADTSLETLAKLKPAFQKDGTVTAGNAPSVNDGAAAALVTTAEFAKAHGLAVQGRILAWATAGLDPEWVTMAPVPAIQKLLKKTGVKLADIDLFELNEAFAAQSLGVLAELPELDPTKVNLRGGAIALGHPIGASGIRVVVTLAHQLRKRGGGLGVATLGIGGGLGLAVLLEVS